MKPLKREIINYLIAGIMMSLAWSLRGQFGHLKGALIPGAVAAIFLALLAENESWSHAFGKAMMVSSLGFCLGGHLSYGKLIESVLAQKSFGADPQSLLGIFFTGAIWGGLGMTFLGFGFSEKPLTPRDVTLFAILGLFWLIPLGIFNLERYDLVLYAAGFVVVHAYNFVYKKSFVIPVFAIFGILGLGVSFLLAVAVLYFGKHGLLGNVWPWWNLRDQWIGFLFGMTIWNAARVVMRRNLSPAQDPEDEDLPFYQRSGFIFYLALIPGINAFNVFQHWELHKTIIPDVSFVFLKIFFLVSLVFVFVKLLQSDADLFRTPRLNPAIAFSSLFFLWYLALLAILKETALYGWERWEPAFTWFLAGSWMLTFYFRRRCL